MAEQTKKKKKLARSLIGVYIVMLLVLYAVIYAFPKVTGALTPTMTLTYDELKVWEDVTCYLVRSEKVYTAEKAGEANYYVKEGAMARKGTRILDVTPASGGAIKNYNCEKNGIISYYIDGNESWFTPETMAKLKEEDLEERDQPPKNTVRSSVLSGEPLYKLIDNTEWYAICWVDQSSIAKFKKNSAVTLELPMGSVKGTIFDIVDKDGKWLVILRFNRYYEDLAKTRKTRASVITEDYKGLLIPNQSLVTVDGKVGVYVKRIGGDYDFVPVKIITTDGENSLVQDSYFYEETEEGGKKATVKVDTVKIYDEILKSGKP